jgi:hypothetical protein
MPTPSELREIAEARFKKKELQRLDGCAATAEYEAESRATIEKTARLKALRLSRDVAAPAPAPAAAPKVKVRRPAKARIKKAVSAA